MKLRNKLIPLMSVVTATTCVAPIATSCSNSSDAGMVDITKNYVPTISKAAKVTEATSDVDAQDLYFQHLAENPEILAQDVYKYQADYLPSRIEWIEYYNGTKVKAETQQYIAKNVTAKVGVSNISFRKINYVDKSGSQTVDKSFYAVSCDLKYHFTFSALTMDGEYELDADLNFNASLHDIPTEVYAVTKFNPNVKGTDAYTKVWRVSNVFTKSKLLDAVPGWSYTFDRKDSLTQTTVDEYGQKQSKTTEMNSNGIISRKEQITDLLTEAPESDYYDEFLSFDSYHLSDVNTSKFSGNTGIHTNDAGQVEGTIYSSADEDEYYWSINLQLFDVKDDLVEILNDTKHDVELYFGYGSIPTDWDDFYTSEAAIIDPSSPQPVEVEFLQEDLNKTKLVINSDEYTAHLFDYYTSCYKWHHGDEWYRYYDVNDNIVSSEYMWYVVPQDEYTWWDSEDPWVATDLQTGTKLRFKLPEGEYGYAYADPNDEDVFVSESFETSDEMEVLITVIPNPSL